MKKLLIICFILFKISPSIAQDGNLISPKIVSKHSFSYKALKEYEGLYEYVNNTTLKIAASPVDTILYAIINESKYKLSTVAKDLFLDAAKNTIQFYRDNKNEIAGYYKGNDTLKVLNKKVKFPKQMWYPG